MTLRAAETSDARRTEPHAAAAPPRDRVRASLYPEYHAGNFTRDDQRLVFYSRVQALLRPDSRVLDFGAGRGKTAYDQVTYPISLSFLKGKCGEVVGVDVEPEVVDNPLVDRGVQIDPNAPLPFPDASFDMIVSFAVLEHLQDPGRTAADLKRILKPGGWLCAWTPNRWGYVALGATLIPERLHGTLLRRLLPRRKEVDTFPKFYRLNTFSAINRHFPPAEFNNHSYRYFGPPGYFGSSFILARLLAFYVWIMPSPFATFIHVFLQKKDR